MVGGSLGKEQGGGGSKEGVCRVTSKMKGSWMLWMEHQEAGRSPGSRG